MRPIDVPSRQTEQGRDQRHRGGHHHGHRNGGHESEPGDVGDAGESESCDGDHHRSARDQHRLPGGPVGQPDGLVDFHARVEVLAMTGDDEQRVVDPDPEPDHRGKCRSHRADVGDGRDDEMIDSPTARPKRAVPIGMLMATTEPNAISRMMTAKTRPMVSASPPSSRLEVVGHRATELDPQARVLGGLGRELRAGRACQGAGWSLPGRTARAHSRSCRPSTRTLIRRRVSWAR